MVVVEYEAKIADLERKVGQLTMEPDLVKKIQRPRPGSGGENFSLISGPRAAPSDGVRSDADTAKHLLLPPHSAGQRAG